MIDNPKNYYEIRDDRTYTAAEVRRIVEGQGEGFRKAFGELQDSLEKSYAEEVARVQGAFSQYTAKWRNLDRWATWFTWAMFWVSGFAFRPFFDLVWSK